MTGIPYPAPFESPCRLVLIGCGAVAQLFYVPAIREAASLGACRLVSVADPSESARDSVASQFPDVRSFADAREALEVPADLAIVASPPRFHPSHAAMAFAAGLHVLCEKPMAATADECRGMISAAERAGRILAAGHYKRWFPAHQAIKALLEQSTFGSLLSIEIAEGGRFGWPAASDSFFRKEQTPGGVLLDIGVHVLDLLLWWLGKPAAFRYQDDALDGLEANCTLEAEWSSGTRGSVRLSRDWETPNCYCLRFEKATLHCRVNASNRLELTLGGLPFTLASELREPLPARPTPPSAIQASNPQSFVLQLLHVISCCREGRSPAVDGHSALAAMEWIGDCYAQRPAVPASSVGGGAPAR